MAREPWLMELGCESGESVAGKAWIFCLTASKGAGLFGDRRGMPRCVYDE
jgi:hypothetical protein